MEVKILEIRDRGTFFAVLAVNMNHDLGNGAQRYHLRRCGYPCDGTPNIGITHLSADGGPFSNDAYYWGGRTYPVAHNHILQNWQTLRDGDVVDVEYILGETTTKKISERFEGVDEG